MIECELCLGPITRDYTYEVHVQVRTSKFSTPIFTQVCPACATLLNEQLRVIKKQRIWDEPLTQTQTDDSVGHDIKTDD